MDASAGMLGNHLGGNPAGGSIELPSSGMAEVGPVLMSRLTWVLEHFFSDSCVLTGGVVSSRLVCVCLECSGG